MAGPPLWNRPGLKGSENPWQTPEWGFDVHWAAGLYLVEGVPLADSAFDWGFSGPFPLRWRAVLSGIGGISVDQRNICP